MIIGDAAAGHPSYAQFLALALPAGLACLAANAVVLGWLFRKELPAGPLAERAPPRPALDRVLAAKGLGALALFAGLALAHVNLAGAAMTAAAALMLVARIEPRRALEKVDWQLLVFFAGLFVVVGGLARTGALEHAFGWIAPVVARGDAAGDAAFVG